MRGILLAFFCMLCFVTTEIHAIDRNLKIGDFVIAGLDDDEHFILDDGNTYKPADGTQKEKTLDWQLHDLVLVLKHHSKNRYVLVNQRTGENAKMKITSLSDT